MTATPQQVAAGASTYGPLNIQDQSGAMVYLLVMILANGGTMLTPNQVAAGAALYGPIGGIQDQSGAKVYLLEQILAGGGTGGGGVPSGAANPVNGVTTGVLYYQTTSQSLWASGNNGATWIQLVA